MESLILVVILVVIFSLLLSITTTPVVIKSVIRKNLMDVPDGDRKIHSYRKPTMGGIAIFFSMILVSTFFIAAGKFEYPWILTTGLALMFFTGFKDDLVHIPATKKLLVQIIGSLVVIQVGDLTITSFIGLFSVYDVPSWIALPVTLFTFIFVINAYNLIDGVDGLASGVGIISASFFGIWHFFHGEIGLAILAFSLVGALLGFLFYNFSPAKIFMGDTGSLVIGFTLATLAVAAIHNATIPDKVEHDVYSANIINLSLAALIVPIYDTLRVFTFRILKRKSPFSPGKDHIHHAMLRVGFTHRSLSLTLYFINAVLIVLVIALIQLNLSVNTIFFSLVFASGLILPTFSVKRRLAKKIGWNVFPQVNPDILPEPEMVQISPKPDSARPNDDPERSSVRIEDILN
jgi:UDP-N-acetylmuramyl pentapeptide phosphotransferase/UDP-N-acetylglucosamine-1-phosphate transferase